MRVRQTAYYTEFNNLDSWLLDYPWGTPDSEQGEINPGCLKLVDDGLRMVCYEWSTRFHLMPRVYWGGAPFSYGLFEAEMTVPPQGAVPDFCLYSESRYKLAVRSILPEIDIAEHGTREYPDKVNIAVHSWKRKPEFINHPTYQDAVKRHSLDYLGHKQTSKRIEWTGKRTKYQCEVTRWGVKVYVDGKRRFRYLGCIEAVFNPTFGISVPNHIKNPDPKHMILHNFKVYQ